MNKLLYTLIGIVGMFLTVAFITISSESKAGIFDDIRDAVTGHIEDAKDRFKDDQFATGITITESTFSWSSDSIHYANGGVKIIKNPLTNTFYVQLNEDFSAGFAPDLYIYAAKGHITSDAQFVNGEKIELGKLVKGSGASYYEISKDLVNMYSDRKDEKFSIVIHCKRFNEPMGAAHFN